MKYLIIIFLTFFASLFNSCTKPCEDYGGLEQSKMIIYPFNLSTGNYMYPDNEALSTFKRDSLQVINENGVRFVMVSFPGQSDPRNPLKGFYSISIAPAFIIPDDNDAFNSEKIRKIYLKYNYNTIDTLSLVFKAKKTKCDKSEYEYLKIYHRNNLIASINSQNAIDFTLNH
ncbi:MAG: hypothetical protein ABL872_11695 [Lacibacter sp.]